MILKQKKSSILIILILLNLMLISLAFNNQKINIFKADLREKFISLDLGVSSIKNLLDDGSGEIILNKSNKLIILIKKIPSFFYYKLFDKDAIQFEKIFIDIKFKDYQKLMLDRNNGLRDNFLTNPSITQATLRYKNNKFKAKIRLKGDLNDHWTSSHRMSFKISLKNEKTILGFNKFAIQKPSSRQHPYDYIYQSMMRDMGNLASVHKFAHIFVNGDSWGIMDIEELMSKELLEKQNRKNSAIVKFSNDERWAYQETSKKPYGGYRLSDPLLYLELYNKKSLKGLVDVINKISNTYDIVWPLHPRTAERLKVFGIRIKHNIKCIPPSGYIDFMCLQQNAKLIITDSGGIQEESSYFNTPCLTVRENTERPVTIDFGTNKLIGIDYQNIISEIENIDYTIKSNIEYWDGSSSERIVKILMEKLNVK